MIKTNSFDHRSAHVHIVLFIIHGDASAWEVSLGCETLGAPHAIPSPDAILRIVETTRVEEPL